MAANGGDARPALERRKAQESSQAARLYWRSMKLLEETDRQRQAAVALTIKEETRVLSSVKSPRPEAAPCRFEDAAPNKRRNQSTEERTARIKTLQRRVAPHLRANRQSNT